MPHGARPLDALIAASDVGVLAIDRSGRIAYVNDAASALLRREAGQLRGRDLFEAVPDVIGTELEAPLRAALVRGEHATVQPADPLWGTWLRVVVSPGADGVLVQLVDVADQVRRERELVEARAKYAALFDAVDAGVALVELLHDDRGHPVDWVIHERNRAHLRMSGPVGAEGRRGGGITGPPGSDLLLRLDEVARTGTSARIEGAVARSDLVYDVHAARLEGEHPNRLVLVFHEVSDLRRREAHAELEAAIADDFARLASAAELVAAVGRRIGGHLGADRLAVVTVDDGGIVRVVHGWSAHGLELLTDDDLARLVTLVPASAVERLRRGETLAMSDASGEDGLSPDAAVAFDTQALVAVPLVTDGRLRCALTVSTREPRRWRVDEVELLRDVARSLWLRLERSAADEALRASEERSRLLVDALPAIAFTADPDGSNIVMNRRWYQYTGVLAWDDEPGAKGLIDAAIHPDEQASARGAWERGVSDGLPFGFQCRMFDAHDGSYRWYLVHVAPMHTPSGEVLQWVGTATDIDDQKRVEVEVREHRSELIYHAHHDVLTGLPNRVLLEDRLAVSVAAATRHDRVVGVLFIDLDGFKLVNDTLGHAAGDALLIEVARRLRASLRGEDTLARLHGDEFVAVLHELRDPEQATLLARKLLDEVARPIVMVDNVVSLSASIGIAVFPRDGAEPRALMRSADLAMYRAKLAGKNAVRLFDDTTAPDDAEPSAVAALAEGAFERGEVGMVFQPLWDRRTGCTTTIEALLRWSHPDLGSVSPVRFVPLLEERGGFDRVVAWSFDEACRCVRSASDAVRMPMRVALNVAGARLGRPSLLRALEASLEAHALEPGQIELEFAVRFSSDGVEALAAPLERVKALGVRVVLDRFDPDAAGTAPVLGLPIDGVKIDRVAVRRAGADGRARRGVRSLVRLAHDLGLDVTAVGVETVALRELMLELGCERIQGDAVAPAMGADALASYLAAERPSMLF